MSASRHLLCFGPGRAFALVTSDRRAPCAIAIFRVPFRIAGTNLIAAYFTQKSDRKRPGDDLAVSMLPPECVNASLGGELPPIASITTALLLLDPI